MSIEKSKEKELPPMIFGIRIAFYVVVLTVLASGCIDKNVGDGGPTPADNNHQLPVFLKPFRGQFLNSNPFDHQYPLYPVNDGNTDFITFQGENLNLGWDGHNGNDWVMPTGTPLLSVADGIVVTASGEECTWANANGDTLVIRIRHTVGDEIFESIYAHVSEFKVKEGDSVQQGELIGLSGNTGCSTGPHLHFSVVRVTNTNNSTPVKIDPFGWEGVANDPWEYHPDGAQSLWLWKPGNAPYHYGYP